MDRYHLDRGSLSVYKGIVRAKLQSGGVAPSIPELVESTGYSSTKPINDRLKELERTGLIARNHGTPRSIRIAGESWSPPKVPNDLTPRQTQVFRAIIRHAQRNGGNPPTLSDLGDALSLQSDSTARYHVQALVEKGHLTKEGGNHRSLRVVGATYEIDLEGVPELGRGAVSAILAEEMVNGG